MKKYLNILLVSVLFISLGLIKQDIPYKSRLKKVVHHTYSSSGRSYINEYHLFYSNNQIDSIYYYSKFDSVKFEYVYKSGICEVFLNQKSRDTVIKYFQYEFDSLNRLTRFVYYANNKIINDDKYYYDKYSGLMKKSSIHGYFNLDSVNYSEEIYFVNNSNIDSVYHYYFLNDTNKILGTIRKLKYDNKKNPLHRILYFHIYDEYFNTNNIVAEYRLNLYNNTRDTLIYDYKYDNEGYLIKDITNHFAEETDSSITEYYYD